MGGKGGGVEDFLLPWIDEEEEEEEEEGEIKVGPLQSGLDTAIRLTEYTFCITWGISFFANKSLVMNKSAEGTPNFQPESNDYYYSF